MLPWQCSPLKRQDNAVASVTIGNIKQLMYAVCRRRRPGPYSAGCSNMGSEGQALAGEYTGPENMVVVLSAQCFSLKLNPTGLKSNNTHICRAMPAYFIAASPDSAGLAS
jgi:hypothetical protein